MSRTYRKPPICAFPRSEWNLTRARGPKNKWTDKDVLDAPRVAARISRDRADCRMDRNGGRGGMTMGQALRHVAKTRIRQGINDWMDDIHQSISEEFDRYDDEQEYLAFLDDIAMMTHGWDELLPDDGGFCSSMHANGYWMDDAIHRSNRETSDILHHRSTDHPACI